MISLCYYNNTTVRNLRLFRSRKLNCRLYRGKYQGQQGHDKDVICEHRLSIYCLHHTTYRPGKFWMMKGNKNIRQIFAFNYMVLKGVLKDYSPINANQFKCQR